MNDFDDIKRLFIQLKKNNAIEIKRVSMVIGLVIKGNEIDENVISHIFDKLLDCAFIDDESVKPLFDMLANYCMAFNPELALDYKKTYNEFFSESSMKL